MIELVLDPFGGLPWYVQLPVVKYANTGKMPVPQKTKRPGNERTVRIFQVIAQSVTAARMAACRVQWWRFAFRWAAAATAAGSRTVVSTLVRLSPFTGRLRRGLTMASWAGSPGAAPVIAVAALFKIACYSAS